MGVPGFMGMALSMSEINKKLNALSQQNNNTVSMSAPLRAAAVKPVPKNRAPLWVAAGLCVAVIAGGTGWWLGSQSPEIPEILPAVASVETTVQQADAQPLVEMPAPDPVHQPVEKAPVVEPVKAAETVAEKQPEKRLEKRSENIAAQPQSPAPEPEVVKLAAKPIPASRVEVKKVEAKKEELKPAVVKAKETAKATHKTKLVVAKQPSQNVADIPSVESYEEELAEGLSIETVELDAGQLANVEYQKAKKALKTGDSRKAIGYLESALKYQPEWVKARQKLSALYYGRGDTRKAIATLQQGLALDGEQPDLRLTMAKLLVNESQQQAALNVLSRLPVERHSGYLAMRGALAQQLKNNELAMSSYKLLVKDEPYDGRWWMGLGIALERSEAAEKARNAYQQALLMGRISQQSQQFIQQRLAVLEAREG